MPLEHNRYCFGVLLVYAVTAMTLPTGGWCEPTGHTSRPDPRPALLHESAGDFPTGGLALSGAERPQLDRRPAEDSVRFPSSFHNLENGNGTLSENETSALTPKPTMASTSRDKSFETRNKPKRSDPPNQDCDKGRIERLIPGKFYITGQLERNPSVGYQAHSAASVQPPGGPQRIRGQQLRGSESWQRLQPEVQCGDDSMTLTVRRRRAVQLQLDRVNESSVPLSQLPPQCGYSVQTTWRGLSLMARYDACHVTQEGDRYTLHLLWRGTPVQMSCPATRIQPQATGPSSLCCSPHGMTVKVQGLHAMEELSVNVRGEWTPLVELAEQCGYRLERQDADFIIAAPFITCGVTVKDGKYTLSLQMGEKTFTLACPISPHEELSLTHQPVFNNPHLTRGPAEHMPESLHPFPWAPPFYLAPPYYPHPTYYHKYPSPDEHTADIPPTPSPSTPGPTFGPHPLPAVDSQPDYHNYYAYPIPIVESYTHFGVHGSLSSTGHAEDSDWVSQAPSESPLLGVSKRHSSLSSNTDLPIQVESPPLQPPSHAFNPYYHYYHHPKIPLPGPPQDPYPGPEVPREVSLTNPNNPENLVLPHNMDQSEALRRMNLQQFLQPVSHTLQTSPPKASAMYTPHPAEPFPNYYSYYFPHIAQFEAIRLAPLNPDTAANLPDHQNSKTNDFVHPLPCPSQVHDGYNLNTIIDSQNTDRITVFQKNMPEGIKPPLLSELNVDVKAELDARVAPAVQPPLRPTYPPGPAAVAAPLPEQPSFPTPSPKHNLPPYPYYYHPYYLYQMYYGTEGLLGADNPVSPTSSKEAVEHLPRASSSPTQHPSYTNPQTTTPTKPMYDVYNDPLHPYYYYYSYYNTPQHPYDAFGRHGGEKAEERLDDEMKDQLGAEPPSALGVGPASYIDFSVSLGCCLYTVKDCTMGQHFIFAMPDSVVEPAVAPPAHPSERSNVSCTLQKLTPDLYAVPLDGCGVSKHVFGQTVVHRLEVDGILSLQQDHSSEHENSPIRLMVECSSFPGFPGEVRLHVMDQPPPPPVPAPPATGTVLLRIATDESFTSFHPEAHLPLSLMRGRPIYVEVSLLDPPKPGLVLLVHSCLAFTQAPYASWMLVYDGCPRHSQLLPSPRSNHIRRFIISDFLSLHSESPSYMAEGGYSYLWDPEIYFLCLTELCSTADGDCTVGCINNPISGT